MQRKFVLAAAVAPAAILGSAVTTWAAAYTYTNTTATTLSAGFSAPNPATGYTSYSYFNYGTVSVMGDATIGSTTASVPMYYANDGDYPPPFGPYQFYNGGDSTQEDGSTTHTGEVLNVGDSTHNVTLTVADVQTQLNNYGGNTISIASGSTLALLTNTVSDTSATGTHASSIYNWLGAINLGGTVQFQPSAPGYNQFIYVQNYGNFAVTSNSATLQRLPGESVYAAGYNASEPSFVNNGGATLSGNGTLTYLNSTGYSSMNGTTIINYGTVAPGTISSPGTLTLNNLNLEFGSGPGGVLDIRLGGTSAGQFDALDLTGVGAALSFGPNTQLNVSTIDGFTPQYGETWTILNYASGSESGLAISPNYLLSFGPTSATLEYVPEPASISLLTVGALGLLRRRR